MHNQINLPECAVQFQSLGDGPPLVCLHSSSGVRISPAVQQLSRTFKVFLPACPGFDGSAVPDVTLSMPRLADWIGEFIDRVIGEPVGVTGHSFGGWAASWLAARRPELVHSLVLQAPIGFGPPLVSRSQTTPQDMLARTFAHPERRPPETKSEDIVAANREMAARYGAGVTRDSDLLERLRNLSCRTLILHGEKDGIVAMEGIERVRAAIPLSTVTRVPDAAHHIEADQPEQYASLVKSFMSSGTFEVVRT
jgi:pimeloyl-ACP methyl ester carboxylesterase